MYPLILTCSINSIQILVEMFQFSSGTSILIKKCFFYKYCLVLQYKSYLLIQLLVHVEILQGIS